MKIGDVCKLLNGTELSGEDFIGDGHLIPKGERVIVFDIFGGEYIGVETLTYRDDKGTFKFIVMQEELECL